MTYFLLGLLGTLYFCLFCIAYLKTRRSKEQFQFIYGWAFWLGAFVWEDLLIFCLYHMLTVAAMFVFHDLRVGALMAGIFWTVRSSGEMMYFFLQQFHEPKHHPHHLTAHFSSIHFFLGDISDQKNYILMQTLHQTIIMVALTGLSILFLSWENLPAWLP